MQGLVLSFITVVLWSLVILLFRYASGVIDANPIVFACISLFGASGILILIAGPGKGGLATLRSPHTWLYGLFQVLLASSEIAVTRYVTATEASLFLRFSIVMSVLASFLFLKRRIHAVDVVACLMILLAFGIMLSDMTLVIAIPLSLAVIAAGVFQTGRTLITELHPAAMQASTLRERCRVVGYVLFVTSLLSLAFFVAVAALKDAGGSQLPAIFAVFPAMADFGHRDVFVVGILTGAVVWSAGMYFYFYSVRLVKTEVFLMVTAFMPLVTALMETAAHQFGLFPQSSGFVLEPRLCLTMGMVMLGALIMIYGRQRRA